jgi:hypothetical protein
VTAVRTRLYDQLGRAVNHNPAVLMRTQDLPPLWEVRRRSRRKLKRVYMSARVRWPLADCKDAKHTVHAKYGAACALTRAAACLAPRTAAQENSCIYIFKGETLLRRHQRIGERPLFFEMSGLESIDIDEEHDWTLAAALMPSVLAAAASPPAAVPAPAAAANDAFVEAPAESTAMSPATANDETLVLAQPLCVARATPREHFDILVSAPYMTPHMARFTEIMASFGLRAVVPHDIKERLTEEQLLAHAGCFDGAICGDDAYTARVFAACAPRLKVRQERRACAVAQWPPDVLPAAPDCIFQVISKWGTGIDSIDKAAAAQHGVTVCNTPGAFTHPVADRRAPTAGSVLHCC